MSYDTFVTTLINAVEAAKYMRDAQKVYFDSMRKGEGKAILRDQLCEVISREKTFDMYLRRVNFITAEMEVKAK